MWFLLASHLFPLARLVRLLTLKTFRQVVHSIHPLHLTSQLLLLIRPQHELHHFRFYSIELLLCHHYQPQMLRSQQSLHRLPPFFGLSLFHHFALRRHRIRQILNLNSILALPPLLSHRSAHRKFWHRFHQIDQKLFVMLQEII